MILLTVASDSKAWAPCSLLRLRLAGTVGRERGGRRRRLLRRCPRIRRLARFRRKKRSLKRRSSDLLRQSALTRQSESLSLSVMHPRYERSPMTTNGRMNDGPLTSRESRRLSPWRIVKLLSLARVRGARGGLLQLPDDHEKCELTSLRRSPARLRPQTPSPERLARHLLP